MPRVFAIAALLALSAFMPTAGGEPIRVAYCSEPGVCYNRPGEPRAGVVVDWMSRIGDILDRPIEWIDVTQARAEEMLERNEIDIIGGLIFRVERARRYYYFPHATGQWKISLYTRADGREYRSAALEDHCTIGNVRSFPITDGIMAAMARYGRTCEIREYDTVPQMEDALRTGEVDAILADGIADGTGIECVACDLSVPQYLMTGRDRWDLIGDIERAMLEISEDRNFNSECRRRNYPLDPDTELPTFDELLWLDNRIENDRPITVDISEGDRFAIKGVSEAGRVIGSIGGFLDRLSRMAGFTYRVVPVLPGEKAIDRFGGGEVDIWFPSEFQHTVTPEIAESNGWETIWIPLPQASCVRRNYAGGLLDGVSRIAVWEDDHRRLDAYRALGFSDRLVLCGTMEECMEAVASGRADCLVVDFHSIRDLIDEMALGDCIEVGYDENVMFGKGYPFYVSRNAAPQLVSLIRHFVGSLNRDDFLNMRLRAEAEAWVPTMPVSKVMVYFVILVIVVLLVFLALLLYWQRRLSVAYRASQSANRAKSTFIATMSHEIRTPLNAIIGFAEFLRAKAGSEADRQGYVDGITHASNALLSLINDILDISKLDAGKDSMLGGHTDLSALAEEMKSVFGFKFSKKGVSLSIDIARGMPVIALQEIRMRQILFNLIGNASKFTERGGVRVSVEWNDSERRLGIRVSDTGIGISRAAIDGIFSPFEQDGSVRGGKVYEGTGLGLAIVKRLVESAGGTISVESEVGVGTTFSIVIPNVKTVDVSPDDVVREAAVPANPSIEVGNLTVVIVDDVKMNLTILRQHLRMAGVPLDGIKAFSDAREALSALAGMDASGMVVLTDMWMPGMNGEQFASAIRGDSRLKNIPVVAVTADADSGKTFEIGKFSSVLTKPVTGQKIREMLVAFGVRMS